MLKFNNKTRILLTITIYCVLLFSSLANGTSTQANLNTNQSINQLNQILPAGDTIFQADTNAEYTKRSRTVNLISQTRAIASNNATSLDMIFYRLVALQTLDPLLGNLSSSVQTYWINQVLSFQNRNGGFGAWYKDTSSISNTYKALAVLDILNYDFSSLISGISVYMERLRNSLTNGYNSNLADGDSDVTSTYYAVKSYAVMGNLPPVDSDVADSIKRAQNTASNGGFGLQSNNLKGIEWTSEVSTSFKALEVLKLLGTTADNENATLDFIKVRQTSPSSAGQGGFTNTELALDSDVTLTYTTRALNALNLSNTVANDAAAVKSYILSLENTTDGSFKIKSSTSSSSLKATYFAIIGLDILSGSRPSNIQKTIDYLVNFGYNTDGYGGVPSEEPTMRETFDAVAALQNMGITPSNPTGITDYVKSYRNPDGGYGSGSKSYVDSTNRAMNIYDILGISYPNPSETITYLQSRQNPDGSFNKQSANLTSLVVSTYRAVYSLSLLNSQPLNPSKTITYLKATQNADGGFGGFIGDSSDVSSTYRAIRALLILGDKSFNVEGAISFLKASQNPDGGFKRSPSNIDRPKNISQAVYTYAGVRSLYLLGEEPTNVTGVFYYVESLRNNDAGFAKHPQFTSDNAYTFTSMWILNNFDEISGFSISVPDYLNSQRTSYDNFTLGLLGKTTQINYTVTLVDSNLQLANGLSATSANVSIDTSAIGKGSYSLNIYAFDFTGAEINQTIPFLVADILVTSSSTSDTSLTTQTTPAPKPKSIDQTTLAIIIAGGSLILVVAAVAISRRK
ncbi:MAG: prenyltransferase/squalene oxidase repeat-containing protein [Candidatus Heimdallarchaeota archaeon]